MRMAFIDLVFVASDFAVELNLAHRSSCYPRYADTGLTGEMDVSEVKCVFHNHGVRDKGV